MSQMVTDNTLSTAEAFYRLLSALSLQERIAITHYILADEQVQQSLAHAEVPNSMTLQAFA